MAGAPIARPLAEYSLAEGYGRTVVEAREKHGLSRDDLAKKLFISEHELARIEEEKLKPREQIARKLERELRIKLVSEATAATQGGEVESSKDLEKMRLKNITGSGGSGLSLADVVSIKHKK
jgi:putative transcription factor